MPDVTLSPDGQVVEIAGLGPEPLRFHAMWLRDNARDEQTRSPENGQKLITVGDIPEETAIVAATADGATLTVSFQPENRTIGYDLGWLLRNAYDRPARKGRGRIASVIETWDSPSLAEIPQADMKALKADSGRLREWLKAGALFDVVDLFGYVRETNYGRHFEVRTEVNPTNLAFSNLGLQAHTDNPYTDPVPTLQGGPMNAEEVAQFETQPSFHEIVAVRYLDDAGKRVGMATPEFAHFVPMLQRMVDARSRDGSAEQVRIIHAHRA